MSKLTTYLKETKTELGHVNWPTRNQTIIFTVAVVLISLAVAYLLGLFDAIFSAGLSKLLGF